MGICRVIVYVEARTSEKESATGVSRTSRSKLVPSSTFGYKPQLLTNQDSGVRNAKGFLGGLIPNSSKASLE